MDTLEYQALTDLVSNRGRFRVYEGESRGHFDIVCECKPTSSNEELSLGLVAQISKMRRDLFRLDMVGTDVKFFTPDQTDMIAFALRVVELIQGDAVNMLIDLVSCPVRISRPHYTLAERYDVVDNPDDALKMVNTKEPEPEPEPEEEEIVPEPEPKPKARTRAKTTTRKAPIRKSTPKTPADLTFDDVL